MGGKAFKESGLIGREAVQATFDVFLKKLHDGVRYERSDKFTDLPSIHCTVIGGALKNITSNDIDVAVKIEGVVERLELVQMLKLGFGQENVKRTGAAEHVLMPISSTPQTSACVQVDVFLVQNVDDAQWLMGDIHRNLLLAMMARKMSDITGLKRTIKFPGGLAMKWDSGASERKSSPRDILQGCGMGYASLEEAETFEGLAKIVQPHWLCDWPDYAKPISDRPGFKEACDVVKELSLCLK